MKFLDYFKEECPNCLSACTGGHPDPGNIKFCVVCSDPKTGEVRGWVWKNVFLHNILVANKNFKRYINS